jgi:hypothetical protein
MTATDGIAEVNSFIDKLHSFEYVIDPKANDIPYDDRNLSKALADDSKDYDDIHRISPIPPPTITQRAFNVITTAFAHGVVLNQNDTRKKLEDAEKRLNECEGDKATLVKDNNNLRQELINCQILKESFQEQLLSYSEAQNRGDHDDNKGSEEQK